MGCCSVFAKIVLVTINLIFFLASALLLAFGIAAKANPSSIATVFNYVIPEATRNSIQTVANIDIPAIVVSNAVFMIVIGVIGLVIAGIGFFGACCTVKWLLVIYAILMILLLLGEVALIIFAAVYTDTFKSFAQDSMNQTLAQFKNDIFYNSTNMVLPTGGIDLAWTTVQLKERCCGIYNWTDYISLPWNKNATGTYRAVPISCCAQQANAPFPPTSLSDFTDFVGCSNGVSNAINKKNCYDAVKADVDNFVQQYKGIAIGIAAGIGGLEIILIILAFVLCAHHERSGKYA